MKDEYWLVIGIAVALLIFTVAIYIPTRAAIIDCDRRGEMTGYNTQRMYQECYVELLEGVWVPDRNLIYYLNMVDCK